MREILFISHGDSVLDNEFTKWLSLKLIALGYRVWCDLLFLDKGVDHWQVIENEIRDNTCRFLPVLSVISNRRPGLLKELAVAEKVKKKLDDERFIIPIVIDEKLSFDDINIDAVRLNAIEFKTSWAKGLRELLEALAKHKVPVGETNETESNALYRQIFLHDKGSIKRKETYDSNWFPIVSFPEEIRFLPFGPSLRRDDDYAAAQFPTVPYNNYLATFASEEAFSTCNPQLNIYQPISIATADVLSGNLRHTDFIKLGDCRRLLVDLTNQGLTRYMQSKRLRPYQMANQVGYWIEKGTLEKDKFNGVKLVGKYLSNTWHYGISMSAKLNPFPVVMISSHIYFTSNGSDLVESDSWQHSSRRRLGKNWWNDRWRRLLSGFIGYLAADQAAIAIPVGISEQILMSKEPMKFLAGRTYKDPEKDTLREEAELTTLEYDDGPDESALTKAA